MYSKWIKSGLVLAMLLISMVSLSMAACPWFITPELYNAQCGVEKVVPASAGLLANDPTGTAVLDPDTITVDAKYGTLDVNADGSFVFDPSPSIQSGTYVQFKYNATNGVCQARYPGLAKILVSCKCRTQAANVNLCLPTTLAEIRQKLEAAGVGCFGCGIASPTIDLSSVKLEPGTYSYSVTCAGYPAVFGTVTLVSGCEASAPNFTFCEGTVTLAQLQGMINAQADCIGTGCDQAPVINTAGVTVANGFVTGGSYTATCGAGTDCADTATGTITVTPRCRASAPSFTFCEGTVTLAQLQGMILAQADCTGTGCDQAPLINTAGVTVANGFVSGGSYTATCGAGTDCADTATGTITVTPRCEASAPNFSFCEGTVTLAQLQGLINAQADCTGTGCDQAPLINTAGVTVANGFVTGGSYTATCGAGTNCADTATGTITVTPRCEANAPSFTFCEGTVTLAQLQGMILAQADCTGTGCDQAPLINTAGVTVANGFVTGGSYTATCGAGTDCADTASGTVTVVPKCVVDLISVALECGTPAQIEAQIRDENSAPCGDCDATPAFQFPVWPLKADGSGNVANGVYQFTVTCNAGGLAGCDSSAIGEVIVDCQEPCPCVATAEDVTVCAGLVTLDQLKENYLPGNVSCISTIGAFCDVTAEIDTSGVTVDANGFVTGGTYKAICQPTEDCLPVVATGTVTAIDCCTCKASAPGFTFCEGTVTLAQLQGMIFAQAECTGTGCDQAPLINTAGVTVANGFVTGGSYTATCRAGTNCEDTASGTITVVSRCEVDLISETIECGTPAQIEAQIKEDNSAPCGDCDATPAFQFPVWLLKADGSGNVANGVYQFTVTCNAGGLAGCDSSAIGEVIVDCQEPCPCVATAEDITVCAGMVTIDELEENYLHGNVSCISTIGAYCDITAEIDTENVTVDTNGFVTGGTYKAICQPTEDCLPVVATGTVTTKDCVPCCEARAPGLRFCEGTVTLDQLTDMIKAQAICTGSGCSEPAIDLSDVDVVDGFVSGGSYTYTATCGAGTACEDTATGTITVVPKCVVDLFGVTFECGTPAQIEAQIKTDNSAPCGDCDSTPTFQFPVWPLRADGSGKVANGVHEYTVTCNAGGLAGCDSSAIGEVIVDCQEPCPCIATAKDVTVCEKLVTLDQLEDNYLPGNVSCISTIGTFCDITAEIDTSGVTVDANGFVTGGTYRAICQPDDDCLAVEATGRVTTKTCSICTCEAIAPDICVPYICTRTTCHKYTLDEIKNEIKANNGGCSTGCTMTLTFYKDGVETSFNNLKWNSVYHYTYKVTCTKGTCVDTDTGKLDVLKLRDCSCTTCNC